MRTWSVGETRTPLNSWASSDVRTRSYSHPSRENHGEGQEGYDENRGNYMKVCITVYATGVVYLPFWVQGPVVGYARRNRRSSQGHLLHYRGLTRGQAPSSALLHGTLSMRQPQEMSNLVGHDIIVVSLKRQSRQGSRPPIRLVYHHHLISGRPARQASPPATESFCIFSCCKHDGKISRVLHLLK